MNPLLTADVSHPSMALTHNQTLTHAVIGLAMKVHSRLGPGLLESVYERCLTHELGKAGIPHRRQVELRLAYDGIQCDYAYRADIIVADEVLQEIEALETILPVHDAQLLTHLRLSGCKVALMLKRNVASLKTGIRRRAL